jgi:hypothetical protein
VYTCALSPGPLRRMQFSNAYTLRRVYRVDPVLDLAFRSRICKLNADPRGSRFEALSLLLCFFSSFVTFLFCTFDLCFSAPLFLCFLLLWFFFPQLICSLVLVLLRSFAPLLLCSLVSFLLLYLVSLLLCSCCIQYMLLCFSNLQLLLLCLIRVFSALRLLCSLASLLLGPSVLLLLSPLLFFSLALLLHWSYIPLFLCFFSFFTRRIFVLCFSVPVLLWSLASLYFDFFSLSLRWSFVLCFPGPLHSWALADCSVNPLAD